MKIAVGLSAATLGGLLVFAANSGLVSNTPIEPAAQRWPQISPQELPAGLGIARVMPTPGGALHFYGLPDVGEIPGDRPPDDSVTFIAAVPSVDIGTAPPWLVPEFLKMDYELFDLRVITIATNWLEVVGNSTTGQTWWIDRHQVQFKAWPEFLVEVTAVEVFDAAANPVRARPLDDASILADTTEPLPPLAVSGDWLKVSIHHLADRMPPEGWIRWRNGDRMLVRYVPLS